MRPSPVQRTLPGDQIGERRQCEQRGDRDVAGGLRRQPHALEATVHEVREHGGDDVGGPSEHGRDDPDPAEGDDPVTDRRGHCRERVDTTVRSPLAAHLLRRRLVLHEASWSSADITGPN